MNAKLNEAEDTKSIKLFLSILKVCRKAPKNTKYNDAHTTNVNVVNAIATSPKSCINTLFVAMFIKQINVKAE